MFKVVKQNSDGSYELVEGDIVNREEAEFILAENIIKDPKINLFIEGSKSNVDVCKSY